MSLRATASDLDDDWEQGLAALQAFATREGHTKVALEHIEADGFRLGNWAGSRRMDYQLGRLTADRIAAMETVPSWVWAPLNGGWERGIAALRAFASREGHAKVPVKHVEADGFKLGMWASSRRSERLSGRLTVERIAALETLPGWVWALRDEDWERGIAALRAFASREGHAKVPRNQVEADGFRLGTWVSKRRMAYLGGRLPADRIAALETLPGWAWALRDDGWERGIAALQTFAARECHAKVPSGHVVSDGFNLGNWVSTRRLDYRLGRLTAERIAALEILPGWVWALRDDGWERGIAALRAFAAREGHAEVPRRHVAADGFRLGNWASRRRRDYRDGRLPADRIAALETLPGWAWAARSGSASREAGA